MQDITGAQLHITDLVVQDGLLYQVTSLRFQGAVQAEVCVELEGVAGRRHYPMTARLTVHWQSRVA